MKKKIAILTQPLGPNYGGIIQNYALQKVLIDNGYKVETINRQMNKISFSLRIKIFIYNLINGRKKILYNKENLAIIYKNMNDFILKYIFISDVINTDNMLKKHMDHNNYDIFIVGSDQTWRPSYSPNIYNYFLDFLFNDKSSKKISYASSFGTDQWEFTEEEQERCKKLLKQFDAVSVREDSGVMLCKKYLNRNDATLVLDPTLLLEASDYDKIINATSKDVGLYTYVLDDNSKKDEFINSISKKLGLQITKGKPKAQISKSESSDINDYIMPPLENWLQGFRDAKFVITDSFHGTVFSIINKKPFVSIINKGRGASRFQSLLSQLGIGDRVIDDVESFDNSLLNKDIDYVLVYERLEKLRHDSLKFLLSKI